jgi:hypothetical protein
LANFSLISESSIAPLFSGCFGRDHMPTWSILICPISSWVQFVTYFLKREASRTKFYGQLLGLLFSWNWNKRFPVRS